MEIGNVKLENNICLAPMAGIGNSAYRRIIKEQGCGLIYAEMVSDKAVAFDNEKTLDMLFMTESERPISQQIFGSDVDSFVIAAKKVEKIMNPDIIDINMGCPVPKVAAKAQAGAALLKDIPKIKEIVSAVSSAVSVPVTVKIRSGWDSNSINAVDVAIACEESGAKAVAIHGRTRSQGYAGKADWNIIKLVKESVSIPVIGNGDIKSCYDAKRMLEETNVDGVMIGRGVLGNPWLIKEVKEYLENGKEPKEITDYEKIEMCKKHFELLLEFKPEKVALLEIRSHAAWYIKGITGSAKIKKEIFQATTKKELFTILDNFLNCKK